MLGFWAALHVKENGNGEWLRRRFFLCIAGFIRVRVRVLGIDNDEIILYWIILLEMNKRLAAALCLSCHFGSRATRRSLDKTPGVLVLVNGGRSGSRNSPNFRVVLPGYVDASAFWTFRGRMRFWTFINIFFSFFPSHWTFPLGSCLYCKAKH